MAQFRFFFKDDREALRSIFRATNGPDGWFNTEGWNTNAELGDWFGVQVNSKSRVVGLHLGDTYHPRDIGGHFEGERDAVYGHLYIVVQEG